MHLRLSRMAELRRMRAPAASNIESRAVRRRRRRHGRAGGDGGTTSLKEEKKQ
jgi:hypothetical protein